MKITKKSHPLTRMINIRLNEPENVVFQGIADSLHTTRTRLLRKVIRELIGQGPDLLDQDLRIMQQAAYQLGCVGRNLNQLLRTIYAGQVPTPDDQQALIESLRDRVVAINEEMHHVIKRSYERWVEQETFKP